MKQTVLIVFVAVLVMLSATAFPQVYSNRPVGKKNEQLVDSLKKTEYPYVLPILGAKAAKAGFDLPYSAGFSMQYLWQKQDIVIENLNVGFNNGPLHNVDEVIRFSNSKSEAQAINIRPDIWVLPFLNVYGIFAQSKPTTTVSYGLWVPNGTDTWQEVFSATSKASFNGTSVGFGITPTIGVAGGWIATDMNFTWTDIAALNKPAFSFIFDPRIGKSFKFRKPQRNIALWVGGFRWTINSGTQGSIPLNTVLPISEWNAKVQDGIGKVDAAGQQVDAWWTGLTPVEQKNPVNVAKHETAERALTAAGNFLNGAAAAVGTAENSSVQYSLDKRPKLMWNFLVGSQFQYNKHWMLRAEYGFLGSRQQAIVGVQYRFGL